MAKHTIVVEFDDCTSPQYSIDNRVLGGRITAVDLDGDRLTMQERLLTALEALADSGELSPEGQAVADAAIEEATRAVRE